MTRLHRHRRRLERRHTQECILDLHLLKTLDVLHLLHRLGSDTKEKFYTSRVLRSHSASTEILYLLWSQHFHIDEPWRSRAAAQLKLIFRFRNLMIPPTQATLRLFQLSHGFLQRCRQHFRTFYDSTPTSSHLYKYLLHRSLRSSLTHWNTTSSPSEPFYDNGLRPFHLNAAATGFDLTYLAIRIPTTSLDSPRTSSLVCYFLKPIFRTLYGPKNDTF